MNIPLNLEPYVCRTDDDGHTYFIPANCAEEFDQISNEIDKLKIDSDEWYEKIRLFVDRFGQFRIGGSDYDIVMWINPEDLK